MTYRNGIWKHTKEVIHPNGFRERKEVQEKDPGEQYQRERTALLQTLQTGKVLPGRDLDSWIHGGIVFTHPQARYYIYHPNCDYGEIDDWSERIIHHTSEVKLTLEQRLQIADCILSQAKELGDFPNEIKDAKAIAELSYEEILQDLESSDYFACIEYYLRETEKLVVKYRAYAQHSNGEEMARRETEN